jgi:hypothetical protein
VLAIFAGDICVVSLSSCVRSLTSDLCLCCNCSRSSLSFSALWRFSAIRFCCSGVSVIFAMWRRRRRRSRRQIELHHSRNAFEDNLVGSPTGTGSFVFRGYEKEEAFCTRQIFEKASPPLLLPRFFHWLLFFFHRILSIAHCSSLSAAIGSIHYFWSHTLKNIDDEQRSKDVWRHSI